MSQMFYSLSLAMGIMITYGSYVQKRENIETAVTHIALFDTTIAFLAGLMIIPAVFSFMGPEALIAGPGLMFITLPKVFKSMTAGGFIGATFFILVFFAALTSAISLMEAVVATVIADEILEKFSSDNLEELKEAVARHRDYVKHF